MLTAVAQTVVSGLIDNLPAGLAGTIGVQILNPAGEVVSARTTGGIVEVGTNTGVYRFTVTAPSVASSQPYAILLDNGAATPVFVSVDLLVTTIVTATLTPTAVAYRDRLRRAIQDGKTSDGETISMARLEDLSDQVMQQATPIATRFQVRFTALPTQGFVSVFVVPETLAAFKDSNPAPVTPTVDVDTNGVFTLATPPAETLLVSYAWQYFQNASLEAFLDEARAWASGPTTFHTLEEVPDGLAPAVIDYAAARALRALAAKLQLATARAGDAASDWSDLTKAYSVQAKDHQTTAEAARKSYYSRADQTLAPASVAGALESGTTRPFTPIH